ncbi:MAG: metallophosphoesterase [Myxococcota bacterium]|jgi:hypothetical protein
MRFFRLAMVAAAVFSVSSTAMAEARYLLDGSNTAWFIQISDTHVDSNFKKYYLGSIEWALGEAFDVIQPAFIVNTGDLTDSTIATAPFYGSGPLQAEWNLYKALMAKHGMTASVYHDVPGNHDAYGDLGLKFYIKNSVQGVATGSTQQAWKIDLPGGPLMFFSAATTANDGKQFPSDNGEMTTAELAELQGFFDDSPDAAFRMCFAHSDYEDNLKNSAPFIKLLDDYGVSYYAHGHEHSAGVRLASGTVRVRIDSIGQAAGANFALWTVDNEGVTVRVYDAGVKWPLVQITAPSDLYVAVGADSLLNPHVPAVPGRCDKAPVRALVFDDTPVSQVSFSVDGGDKVAMVREGGGGFQWRGLFDATKLGSGEHSITVEAAGSATASDTSRFIVEDIACELGPEDPPPSDGGTPDAGKTDAGGDAGSGDSGVKDAGGKDAGIKDAGIKDGGTAADGSVSPDSGGSEGQDASTEEDAGAVYDAGTGVPVQGPQGCSCSAAGL